MNVPLSFASSAPFLCTHMQPKPLAARIYPFLIFCTILYYCSDFRMLLKCTAQKHDHLLRILCLHQ